MTFNTDSILTGDEKHDKHLEIVPLARWRELQEVLQSRKTNRVVGEAGEQLPARVEADFKTTVDETDWWG